ncbi:N-6 DNA methylase [Lacipirellula parvula]|uniref:site-specific DNA-methyltransferase (adenine-specific) n=1 Tax=Lacipirellula parvula TaxID=2650471 RepID=A0A5K7X9W6_9BACT|nr:N-6 DNA methylase [Lacipirellula parvula]BBO33185.1 type I restriction-modification system DNA-methyltransferase subunit M [Lacipirellula parvula]
MAIKKSDLYSSLWASCDELRGGMDASQYKDYVLFMLFIKYVSDKYAESDDFAPSVNIPKGASFKDMVALKGKSDIGDRINKRVIAPLVAANARLARSDFPDFNDPNKLGEGDAMVKRLDNLIGIFQNPALDFSRNRAEHDDILGDAYEYLMRHFATESGKSKGQFYTPSEVSRVIAQVIGITPQNTKAATTAYDPTCGSGSLLLKVAAQSGKQITLEGQERDVTTAGLARMNMILHDFPGANIISGNTLVEPKFKEGEQLRTYDYVVANPPFSDKTWSTGLVLGENGASDKYSRFGWGVPPAKQGDYAYLLHIVRSLKAKGKGACILPHGVLFRGNAEAVIREQLVRSGYLKGIIGLPANLFYGTGIPACILVIDKENAAARKGVFLIDASKGFIKDGNKNRLREQDIHKIVDAFHNQIEIRGYSRLVDLDEIKRHEFNLNLPRYVDGAEAEDIEVTRKKIKNVHLSVYPPDGRVTLTAPKATRLEVARAYAISKLGWIREQQRKLERQARESPRNFIERESHYLWGRRYLMTIVEKEVKPGVSIDHKRITLTVRPGSDEDKRKRIVHEWHKKLLHEAVPPLMQKWQHRLNVNPTGYFLQRMKTKWGSCNHIAGNIRLNTELVKKPKDLLEYVIVHELAHLLEPTHSERFAAILDEHFATWREARVELNELPLAAEAW